MYVFAEKTDSAKDVFAEASTRHQESARRHLQDFADDGDSDDEEEGDIGDGVLQDVFKSYSNNYGKQHAVIVKGLICSTFTETCTQSPIWLILTIPKSKSLFSTCH